MYDVIVVGSGVAGLSAALSAQELGAKVLLLEKSTQPAGNSIFAGGYFNAAPTHIQRSAGIEDQAEALFLDMMAAGHQEVSVELMSKFAAESASVITWLEAQEIVWQARPEENLPGKFRAHFPQGALRPAGKTVVNTLLERAKQSGIHLLFEREVTQLIFDGAVKGVEAMRSDGSKERWHSRGGVILCTGGFSANRALLARYAGRRASKLVNRGSKAPDGANIRLTEPLGARLVGMDQFHAGPIHKATGANPSAVVNYGVLLDGRGKRFIDERASYVEVAQAMPRRVPKGTAWVVFDSRAAKIEAVQLRLERYRAAGAPVFTAQTLEELSEASGIRSNMVWTVKLFNSALATYQLMHLIPANTQDEPFGVLEPPFYALPFQAGISATFGGPAVNAQAEVLNEAGEPIAGLYAAGNAAGGLFRHACPAGSQLTAAVIWARAAAQSATRRAKKSATGGGA